MIKEIEALERIDDYVDKDYDYCQRGDYEKDYKLVKQALTELETKSTKEELFDYLMQFIIGVDYNGHHYISFNNNTRWLDCVEIDAEHAAQLANFIKKEVNKK